MTVQGFANRISNAVTVVLGLAYLLLLGGITGRIVQMAASR
jgi:hypothetical protein